MALDLTSNGRAQRLYLIVDITRISFSSPYSNPYIISVYPNTPQEDYTQKFSDLLRLFWRPEKIAKWRAELY